MDRRPARNTTRLAVLFAAISYLMLLGVGAASAHAVLQSSSPGSGDVVTSAGGLDRVELHFDEPVEAALGAVQVVASDGGRVDTGTVSHPGGAGTAVSVGLRPQLAQGSYLVTWRVVSSDSHPVHGSFTFSVGRAGAVASQAAASSDGGVAIGLGVARFAEYAALLLIVGAAVFFIACLPAGWRSAAGSRLIRGSLMVGVAADMVGIGLQAAEDVGGGWGAAVDPTNLSAFLQTRLGQADLLRLVAMLALWFTVRSSLRFRPAGHLLVAIELTTVLTTVAVTGHGGVSPAAVVVDVLHLAAAGTWLGGLVALLLVFLPSARPQSVVRPRGSVTAGISRAPTGSPAGRELVAVREAAARPTLSWAPADRFSALAMTSVVVLVGTGVVQALRQIPEAGALTGTRYGQLLLVKVGLVGVALAVAAVSRTVLRRRSVGDTARRRLLLRSVGLETLVLLVVVGVTSALVATPPARVAYRPSQERSFSVGPDSISLTAVSVAPLTLSMHLYAFGADGLPAEVPAMTAQAMSTSTDLGIITVPLQPAGTGHFIAARLLLPRAGEWKLTFVVRTSEFDAYTSTTSLTVR